jgi:Barrel-sandwich domain of CusB or HlyD membrane-fusion
MSAVESAVRAEAALALLVQLEQRLRACRSEDELWFLLVNDTHALLPYQQAVLWRGTAQGGRILALSGLAVLDENAPFNVWLAALLARCSPALSVPGPVLPAEDERAAWAEYLPAHAWWLPLNLPGEAAAGLLLLREHAWQEHETSLLALLADAAAHAWRALRASPASRSRTWLAGLRLPQQQRRWWLLGAVFLLLLMALPVRQSVLAPAEVVARAPLAVRAPLQGVVDRVVVQPDQQVAAGQLLVALDARELEGRLEAARQALAVAEAELRQGQQQALFDERSKAGLALLQGRRDQAVTDLDYYSSSLARMQLHAERSGTVILDDPADWVGKPVQPGERILQIADPQDVELEVLLPVADAIALPAGAPVRMFLNSSPASPLSARLLRVGYRAMPTADGSLAYRVRARLSASEGVPRVGLKGTAKLYGERRALILYLLRRPLAAARVWLGI